MDLKTFEKAFVNDEHDYSGFFIIKDVRISRVDKRFEKKENKNKKFYVKFIRDNKKIYFDTETELLDYVINGKTVRQYIAEMEVFNLGNLFNGEGEFDFMDIKE